VKGNLDGYSIARKSLNGALKQGNPTRVRRGREEATFGNGKSETAIRLADSAARSSAHFGYAIPFLGTDGNRARFATVFLRYIDICRVLVLLTVDKR
jgi:hypothetical protein